jgi:hypothetical protein
MISSIEAGAMPTLAVGMTWRDLSAYMVAVSLGATGLPVLLGTALVPLP